jgi:preprotein translocase subunit YajC
MPGAERAEIYFIGAMMVLILILSFGAVYFFVRQYKKEMREKQAREESKKISGQRRHDS